MTHVKGAFLDVITLVLLPIKLETLVGQIFIILSIAPVCQVLRKLVAPHSPHIRPAHDHKAGSHAHKHHGGRGVRVNANGHPPG